MPYSSNLVLGAGLKAIATGFEALDFCGPSFARIFDSLKPIAPWYEGPCQWPLAQLLIAGITDKKSSPFMQMESNFLWLQKKNTISITKGSILFLSFRVRQ